MVRENCKDCSITLSEFEKEEYAELCVDCYREQNNEPKTKRTAASVRLKNKRYVSHIVQG
ncbi:MAG TPA: hypothetical protein VJ824_06310 [Bacillota bacterium]|nr:hypothetical protein [Bacillota bacterium]